MFADYKLQVLHEYKRQKDAKALSPRLIQPTPGNLRAECAAVCRERFPKKDEGTLRIFFGPKEDQAAYIKTIENFDVDKFKPLLKFIKEATANTDIKNVEILAWLIDFEPRPFDPTKKYDATTGNNKLSFRDEAVPTVNDGQRDRNERKEINVGEMLLPKKALLNPEKLFPHLKWLVPILFVVVIVFWSSYILRNPPTANGCMYWAADHYQRISCNAKIDNALIVALDTVRLKYFKKITIPDTITRKSKGLVWYSKINNKIEFFTAGGNHPVELKYRLKPISDYIINKYIHPGITSQ